jgi:hypothetical protein
MSREPFPDMSMSSPMPPDASHRFAWPTDPRHRRARLAEAERAILRGRLPADDRPALAAAVRSLLASGELNPRQAHRASRILIALRGSGTV